jgi:superfamily II DNA/RNA helicase
MFSATMAPKLRELAGQILTNPHSINISLAKPAEGVLQAAYMAYDAQKTPLINSLIKDKEEYQSILIFTSTRKNVSGIVRALRKSGHDVEGISSDLEQKQREVVLQGFANKDIRILVATDVLSRGVDIKDINLVINYDVPGDAADYVHRVGRTARASTTGVAITLINPADIYKFNQIERLIESEVPKIKMPEEFGEAPEYKVKKFQKKKRNYNNKNKRNNSNKKRRNNNNNNRNSNNRNSNNNNRNKKKNHSNKTNRKQGPKPQNNQKSTNQNTDKK